MIKKEYSHNSSFPCFENKPVYLFYISAGGDHAVAALYYFDVIHQII